MPDFKLTYSTMFDPPAELHARFDAALGALRACLGAEHAMLIGGRDERAPRQFAVRSPIDTRVVLGRFQAGEDVHARAAVAAAQSIGSVEESRRMLIRPRGRAA